jgi:hypothetical protein
MTATTRQLTIITLRFLRYSFLGCGNSTGLRGTRRFRSDQLPHDRSNTAPSIPCARANMGYEALRGIEELFGCSWTQSRPHFSSRCCDYL